MEWLDYNLIRGLHIIAVIAWVAGLLMLPRFYAYISGSQPGGELEAAMLKASRNLQRIILTPSLVLAWVLGLTLFGVWLVGDWTRPLPDTLYWFWIKLALVIGLSAYHGYLVVEGRMLARGVRRKTERFWRLMSEAPFIAAIFIILLATLEPDRCPGTFLPRTGLCTAEHTWP